MLSKLKYLVLRLLLDDICNQTGGHLRCDECMCKCPAYIQIGDFTIDRGGCEHQDILYQARKVWRIK